MQSKILLTTIFKDDSEVELADRMLSTFMPYMFGLCSVITGISDENRKLKKLIEGYKGKWDRTTPQSHPKLYTPDGDGYIFSNFAEARNISFEMASKMQETEKYDWWSWADVDDMLVHGEELDEVAVRAKALNLDSVFFTYWYGLRIHEDGTFTERDVTIEHLRERILKPNVFKWVSRLHEVAVQKDDNYKPQYTMYDFNPKEKRLLAWAHATEGERVEAAMQRNIKILETQRKEEIAKGQDDPRTVFYLAKVYYDMNKPEYDQLAEMLITQEYVKNSGWAEERSSAWEYVGNIRARRGDHRGAVEAYYTSVKEFPSRHMNYLHLAKEYAELQLWDESNFWLDVAMKMEPPKTRTTIGNPLEIKFQAASLKVNECIRKTDLDGALYWLDIREKLSGQEDVELKKKLQDAKLLNTAAIWAFNYSKWLKDTGHREKIKDFLKSLPNELGRETFAHYIANEVAEPKVWDDKSIVYYASWGSEHFEQWGPKQVEKGMGGSETAVVELAKRWAKMGYKVTVFGDPRDDAGEYDGVEYRPYYEINWNDTFNILILWRSPHLLDKAISARRVVMDLHDVASQLDWSEERMKKIYKVFFKSKYHRSMVPKLPNDKAVILSNGI